MLIIPGLEKGDRDDRFCGSPVSVAYEGSPRSVGDFASKNKVDDALTVTSGPTHVCTTALTPAYTCAIYLPIHTYVYNTN